MLPVTDFFQRIITQARINSHHYKVVHGGDINETYCLIGEGKKYFLKINDKDLYPQLFEKEAEGLNALRSHSAFIIPGVVQYGTLENKQFLLLEWIEQGCAAPNFWETLGRNLAEMHKKTNPTFGWTSDNYIGRIKQPNPSTQNWQTFYAEYRLLPLVNKCYENNLLSKKDVAAAEKLCIKLDQFFPSYPPALLHGDLWNGNFMVAANGNPCLFDPAVYYGHREMDLGMTRLFGGFHARFYAAYHECFPLETQWEQRIELTQLYPLLVHTLLFGGHYGSQCQEILQRFYQ
jgi:fructosamine-3-kinase